MIEEMEKAKEIFKKFCNENAKNDELNDINWYDMSIGFFLAFGMPLEQAEELACNAYKENYWLG